MRTSLLFSRPACGARLSKCVRPTLLGAGFLIAWAMAGGCGSPAGTIFEPPFPPKVWPDSATEPARVRYVGQLANEADLKPAIPFGQGLGESLFGKPPIRAMITPFALCTDGGDRLFVADTSAKVVQVFDLNSRKFAQWGPAPGKKFSWPVGVAYNPAGRLYVSDSLNFRVQQFSPDLQPLRAIGSKGDMPGFFSQPKGVGVDSQDHLYVMDSQFEVAQVFDDQGVLLMDFGQEGDGAGEFWLPAGIFIDAHNRIWVADSYNHRVQVFDYLPEQRP